MAIKHSTTHVPNDIVASADWNVNHIIDSDVPFNNNKATGVKDPTLNQDAATKKYVDDNILLVLGPPIGSVLSWLKSYTNTPTLPDDWVECNGQVLDDAESVYNGQTIPNLNGDNRFLRGNSTSGGTGGSETHTHTLTFSPNHGLIAGVWNIIYNNTVTGATDTKPSYYEVVWIMRVK